MGHDNNHHEENKPNGFIETCYYSGPSGGFAFFWTIISILFLLAIVLFG